MRNYPFDSIRVPSAITDAIVSVLTSRGRAIVAIDGRGGAGKSSFARALVAAQPDSVGIEYDWFHLPQKEVSGRTRFDDERLAREVLTPFLAGEESVSLKRYNWGYLAGKEDGPEMLSPSPFLCRRYS